MGIYSIDIRRIGLKCDNRTTLREKKKKEFIISCSLGKTQEAAKHTVLGFGGEFCGVLQHDSDRGGDGREAVGPWK